MNNEINYKIKIRKAREDDNLIEIAELIYKTDPYIYPYWFETLEKCKEELPRLLLEENFFFNINNLYVAEDEENNKIVGILCILDKDVDFEYDYEKLKNYNERYRFTIDNYVMGLIKEVKESEFAYISNVCIHNDYRGKKIGNKLISHVIEIYAKKYFDGIFLDVLANNPGAIKLYQNLGFEQFTEIFSGFNNTDSEQVDVFSMKYEYRKSKKR
ncbi:MAG: GNAT family N-acetyltransferase [Bacilli bacterium]|nr:GNAT family N-acetyltransferase [Bacilli bacterium]